MHFLLTLNRLNARLLDIIDSAAAETEGIMKRIAILALIICICAYGLPVAAEEEGFSMGNPDVSDWFEWQWPDDANAYGTPIDASMFFHKPAGKHGFVEARGSEMFFEDNTPARFWGTNIGGIGIFQTKEDAEKLADRIARSGFNIARFHAMDGSWFDNNIFGYSNGNTTSKKIDEKQLDIFFYLFTQLKERGVYSYIDLLCYRRPMPNDGIPFREDINNGWKGEGQFDPYLIELQKEFARQLLTAVNPYTGLALKDDPAVIVIGLTNEMGIMGIGKVSNPIETNYYASILQSMFNSWLAEKYSSRSELEKAWAQEGKTGLDKKEDFTKGTVVFKASYGSENYSDARFYDIYSFLYYLQVDYFRQMNSYIKDDIGYKNLISGVAIGLQYAFCPPMQIAQRETSDVNANNTYKSHPSTGTGYPGTITPWISPTVRNGQEMFQHFTVNRPYNIPHFVTEWQVCSPSHYAPEHYLLLSVYGRIYEVNPINYGIIMDKLPPENSPQRDFFETFSDAMHTSISPLASMIFLRDNIEQPDDIFYRVVKKDELFNKESFNNWFITPWNIWPYGEFKVKYPDIGDDVSDCTGEGLDNMYKKFYNNEPQTKQINWNQSTGIFRLETDYTNAACGFLGGLTIDMADCIFELENQSATVGFTSATEKTLKETDDYLIALVGRSRNTGMIMDDEEGKKIVIKGRGPQILEPIKGYITLKMQDDIEIYSLDSSGHRVTKLEYSTTPEGYKRFYVGAEYKTAFYEVVKVKGNADEN